MSTKTAAPKKIFPRTYVAADGDTPRSVALANGLDDHEVARLNGVLREHVFGEGDKVLLGAGSRDDAFAVAVEYIEKVLADKKGWDSEALVLVQHELHAAGILDASDVTGDYNEGTPKALTLWGNALGYDTFEDLAQILAALGSRRRRFTVIG